MRSKPVCFRRIDIISSQVSWRDSLPLWLVISSLGLNKVLVGAPRCSHVVLLGNTHGMYSSFLHNCPLLSGPSPVALTKVRAPCSAVRPTRAHCMFIMSQGIGGKLRVMLVLDGPGQFALMTTLLPPSPSFFLHRSTSPWMKNHEASLMRKYCFVLTHFSNESQRWIRGLPGSNQDSVTLKLAIL